MGQRRRGREHALQVLFQIDLTGGATAEVLERFWESVEIDESGREFTERLVHGVLAGQEAIDRRVVGAARRWKLERMPVVDRNVLRVAVFELLSAESPPPVVIDEAIEVARRFGGEESAGFINGVLDTIRDNIESEKRQSGS